MVSSNLITAFALITAAGLAADHFVLPLMRPEVPAPSWTTQATVTNVVDGDTLDVEIRRTIRIRLIDCWAPESKIDKRITPADQAAAKRAGIASKAHLTLLAQGQQVIVQIPTSPDGKFADSITLGRALGNVWIQNDSVSLAEKQVAAGHATKSQSKSKEVQR